MLRKIWKILVPPVYSAPQPVTMEPYQASRPFILKGSEMFVIKATFISQGKVFKHMFFHNGNMNLWTNSPNLAKVMEISEIPAAMETITKWFQGDSNRLVKLTIVEWLVSPK